MPEATSMQQQYIFESDSMEEYDIFVSHATEDKKAFQTNLLSCCKKILVLMIYLSIEERVFG